MNPAMEHPTPLVPPPPPPESPPGTRTEPAFLCRCLRCCCPAGQGHNSPSYHELEDD